MPLIADRSVWDWGERIAAEHSEKSFEVMEKLMAAVIDGTLRTTPLLNEDWRQHLFAINVISQIRGRRRLFLGDSPQLAGYWLRQIMIADTDIENWVASRLSPKPVRRAETTPHQVHTQTKLGALKSWIFKYYPKGIPAGCIAKAIAREFGSKTGISVSERTVRRALGRK
jgi:hypothetical protein